MEVKIYTLSSTRDLNNIRYVGKTRQTLRRRLQGHLCGAKKAKEKGIYTSHEFNWINHELSEGYSIVIEEIDSLEFLDGEEWGWLEVYWIEQMKQWGFNLTNIRKGGEDHPSVTPSEDTVKKRAEKIIGIARDEKTKQAISEGLTGIKRSEETKEKVRQSIIEKQGRPVLQYTKDGQFIKEWPAGSVAAAELGIDKANLNACCKGKKKSCGGFVWKYASDEIKETRIIQLSLDNEFIAEFKNSAEAERITGINSNLINRVCRGIQEQTYNYKFKYYNDYYNS